MKLLTVEMESGARAGALLSDGAILCLGPAAETARGRLGGLLPIPDSVAAILADGALDTARRLVDDAEAGSGAVREELRAAGALIDPSRARLAAPLPRPSLIPSHGLAYAEHLEEMGVERPDEPTAFLKAPSSVAGPGQPIVLPPDYPGMVDFEGEFSLVIGRPRHVVAHFSQWYLFRPGDVITTGSPSGVGYGRDPQVFPRAGDLVEISVTGIGTLSNPVVEGRPDPLS